MKTLYLECHMGAAGDMPEMKTLYLECHMGAAGDMLMGALLELLPDPEKFIEKINAIGIPQVAVQCDWYSASGRSSTSFCQMRNYRNPCFRTDSRRRRTQYRFPGTRT